MDRWKDGGMYEWMARWIGQMLKYVNNLVDGWVEQWRNGGIDGWMDGWIGQLLKYVNE